MATNTTTIKFTGQFDTSQITKGLQDIKKQMSNSHIGEDLRKQLETALNKVEANIPALEKMSAKGEFNTKELEAFQKLVQQVSKDMQSLDQLAAKADFTKAFSSADTEKLKQFEKQLSDVENKIKSTRKEIIDAFSSSEQGKINGKSNNSLNGVIEQLLNVPPDQIENKLNEIIKEAENQAAGARDKIKEAFKNSNRGKNLKPQGIIELLFGKDSGVITSDAAKGKLTVEGGVYETFDKIREQILKFDKDTPTDKVIETLTQLSNFINEYFDVPEGKESILINFLPPDVLERVKELVKDIPGLKEILGTEKLKLLADGEAEKLRITQEQAAFLKQRLDELIQSKKLTADQAKAVMEALGGMNKKIDEGSDKLKKEKTQADALNATFGSLANRITNSISALTVFNKSIQIVHKAIDSVRELDAAFTQIAIVSEQSNESAWKMFDSFNSLAKQYSITTKDLTEGAKLFYQQGLNAADTMKMVEASTVSAALGEVTMTEAANTLTAAIQGYNESAAVAMDYTDKIAMVGAVSAADFNELSTAMEKTASSAYTAGIDFDHLLGYLGKMIEVTREAPANLGTAMKTIIARFEDMKKDPMAILEDGVSANKVEAALATIGIALRNSEGEFRALQDVMDELGGKWNSLTRNQQAYIATVAAGSRQQSRFLALMNNYDRTMELVAESQNSAGAAAQQYAVYQDSAAAATARLTAAWEEFYTKIVNSEQIIWVIDRLKDLVETMTKVGPVVSAIGASVGALGLQTIIKGILPKIISNITEATMAGKVATISISGLAKGGLTLALSLGKVVLVIAAISAAIYALVKAGQWLYKQFHKDEEQVKKLVEEVKNLDNEIQESSKKVNSLENLMDRYEELTKKVYLTTEEHKELNDVIDQINENSKRAVVSIDKNGDAHLENAKSIREEIEAEKDYIEMDAKLALAKKKELLGKGLKNITEEQANSVGLTKVAEYKNKTDDSTVENYKKYSEARKNINGNDASSSALFGEFYVNNKQAVKTLNNKYFGEDYTGGESLATVLADVRAQAIEKVEKELKEGETLSAEQYSQKEQKAVDEYTKQLLELVYGNLDDIVANYSGKESNEEQVILDSQSEALTEYYNQMASTNEKYNVLADLFEKSGMSADEFQENIGDENKFLEQYSTAIEEYLNSDKATEDVKKLAEVLTKEKGKIANVLQKWIDDAIKQSFASKEEKNQFIRDNKDLLGGEDEISRNMRTTIRTGSVTNNELEKMQDLAKTNEFIDSDKFTLFNLFAEDNTTLDKYIDDYVKNLEAGFYKKADQIKQTIINLLVQNGMTQEAAEQTADFFINDLNSILEKRLAKAEEDYKTAKGIYNKDSTEALTDKEYEFLQGQDINIDRYVNINEEGEKYLSILGKINLLENTRANYINQTNETIKKNVDDIARSRIEIAKANQELETGKNLTGDGKELTEEQIDARKALIKTNEQLITNLKQENDLLADQLQTQIDINNEAANMALTENISQAQKYYDNIEKIGKALGEAQQNAMHIDWDTALGLLAMDKTYHQYIDIVDGMVTVNAEGMKAMRDNEAKKYNDWLTEQKNQLEVEKTLLSQQLETINLYLQAETEEDKAALKTQLINNQTKINEKLKKEKEGGDKAEIQNKDMLSDLQLQYEEYYKQLFAADDIWKKKLTSLSTDISDSYFADLRAALGAELPTATIEQQSIEIGDVDFNLDDDLLNAALEEEKAQIEKRLGIIEVTLGQLDNLSINFDDAFKKGIESAVKSGGKANDSMKKILDTIEDLTDALKDLDDLLTNIKKDLKDITVDYNPFTDLFEAWEHEWDYYYNIKRFLQQIDTQGKYIDNIISADYVSADKRIEAEQAKIGNLLAKMAANDTYIEALRAGMSQTAVELMKDYGEYYKVDPTTGQLYQTDKNLNDINELMNERKEEIYNLQKLQNEKENDLALENAKLDALEKEKSAYEDILSTVESQLDKLKDNEDITADISGLQSQQTELKAKIEITDSSIEKQKDKIRDMEDGIQDIEVEITLKDQNFQQLEDYVSDMEDKVSEYEEYWENLNSTIAEQQELLSNLNEILKGYIDTAISTQQELYDAIVENYQNEINQKKKEYDYLKKLDDDYLRSIKDNINKQRQAREDANKQKNYQQNIQRAQLLQMDTSGVYRNELASLNKEIENQRQDLYDDLVDKQVEALEKEIDKRHELYDKEVAALEERLAYYQENAILLWEMVNSIVAEGAEAMMATLENTTNYINSNELAKDQQRKTWEYNVKKTFDGVQNHTIQTLENLVKAGNEFVIDKYPEIGNALDEYREVFIQASDAVNQYNSQLLTSSDMLNEKMKYATQIFQGILDSFMSTWNSRTNEFTGYAKNWTDVTNALKEQTQNNLEQLRSLYDEQGRAIDSAIGSIRDYDEVLQETSAEMYQDFLNERNRYRNELENLINKIQREISSAINDAASAIRTAANSVSYNPKNNDGNYDPPGGGGGSQNWEAKITYYLGSGASFVVTGTGSTQQEAYQEALKKIPKNAMYMDPAIYNKKFKIGGLADFTGPAWLDGTKSEPERVLSPKQTKLFESMVSSLERTANNSNINSALGSSYIIGDINTTIQVEKLDNNTDIEKVARQVENRIMKSIRNRVTVSIS